MPFIVNLAVMAVRARPVNSGVRRSLCSREAMKMHHIYISDPMFWEGPDGPNKILAEGLGLVYGSPHFQVPESFYLLRVLRPFEVDGEKVNYLLVGTRYVGDKMESVVNGYCIVGISRVKPDIELKAGDEFGGFDYEYWAIGSIRLIDS